MKGHRLCLISTAVRLFSRRLADIWSFIVTSDQPWHRFPAWTLGPCKGADFAAAPFLLWPFVCRSRWVRWSGWWGPPSNSPHPSILCLRVLRHPELQLSPPRRSARPESSPPCTIGSRRYSTPGPGRLPPLCLLVPCHAMPSLSPGHGLGPGPAPCPACARRGVSSAPSPHLLAAARRDSIAAARRRRRPGHCCLLRPVA